MFRRIPLARPPSVKRRWLAPMATVLAIGGIGAPVAARADAVTTWNNEMLSVIRQTSALLVDGPPEVARQIAIVGTAMSDAADAATGLTYAPYAWTGGAASGVSAEAAALAAGYTALRSIYSGSVWQLTGNTGGANPINYSNPNLINNTILPEIDAVYNAAVAALAPGAAVTAGLALGQAAANAVIARRVGDGASAAIVDGLANNAPAGSGTIPGVYVPPSASGGRPEMFPLWGNVTPFGVTGAQYTAIKNSVSAPPAVTSQAYATALLQTQCTGVRSNTPLSAATQAACATAGFTLATAAQTQAALFWNDPGSTIQPPGHWLQIATTLMNSQGLTLAQKARLTSLVGIAMNDAGIEAWDLKYDANLWRPITAIRDCGGWNSFFTTCQANWQSEIATPPHPDYIAGHPAFSGAAATVLAGFFGVDGIAFCSDSDPYANGNLGAVGAITECYSSISDASSGERGSTFSRVAGGIHTPFAAFDALRIGNAIGEAVLGNFAVAAIPEPGTIALLGLSLAVFAGVRRRRLRSAPNNKAASAQR